MEKLIVLLLFAGTIVNIVAKPTDNNADLIAELKKVLEERYEKHASVREVGSLDIISEEREQREEELAEEEEKKREEEEEEEEEEEREELEERGKEEKEEEERVEELEQPTEEGQTSETSSTGGGDEATGAEEMAVEESQTDTSETKAQNVNAMLLKGWNMLNQLQRVSVALNLENNPIQDNKTPREALRDMLVQLFQFNGLTERVIRELLHSLAPEKDVCKQMFPGGTKKTLERVTNCFIMRFTKLLSLIEHLKTVGSASDLKVEDLVRLTSLERDIFEVSYEIFRILKAGNPSMSLTDIVGEEEAAIISMQETSDTQTSEGSSAGEESGTGEDASSGTGGETSSPGEESSSPGEGSSTGEESETGEGPISGTGGETSGPGEESASTGEGEGGSSGSTQGGETSEARRGVREDLLKHLAKKLKELLKEKRR